MSIMQRRSSLTRHAARATFLVAIAVSVVACGDVINDPTFRQWCGDTLCAWKLEAGHIRKAPTWTDKDYGVEFQDTPTRISQYVSTSPHCLKFSTIGDIDPSTQLTVFIDFDSDGTTDFKQLVPSAQWTEVETLVTAPKFYSGFTLAIEKQGDGRAVLAQMRVQESDECKAPGVVLDKPLPIGDKCSLTDPSAVTCETGICCFGVCSECCSDKDCHVSGTPDGGDAGPAAICATQPVQSAFLVLPGQCGPGDHQHKSGAPCLADADCKSDACDGVIVHGVIPRDDDHDDSGTCDVLGGDAGCRPEAVAGGHCR